MRMLSTYLFGMLFAIFLALQVGQWVSGAIEGVAQEMGVRR